MRTNTRALALALSLSAIAGAAQAQVSADISGEGSTEGASVSESSTVEPSASTPVDEGEAHASDPFMKRYRPTHLGFEMGLYAGGMWFNDEHNLQSLAVTSVRGHQRLFTGKEVGLRLGFYPASFLGIEAEGSAVFSETRTTSDKAMIWSLRGHAILQLPLYRLVPFVVGGGGVNAMKTDNSIGDDHDPMFYFGGGLKFAFNQYVSLRVDVRDWLSQKNKLLASTKNGDTVHALQVLGGLSVTFGRTPWSPAPPDMDGDGIPDRDDQCVNEPGPAPTGCPPPPDSDGDGIPDKDDPCPTEAEDGNPPETADGCPNKDLDADGILVPEDLCPNEPGIAPDGCPPKDTDGDGLMDPDDKCPNEPETVNNFEDDDGCPDEVPQKVKKFTGVIKGILFDSGKATIRSSSFPLLDDAVAVLKEYPTLRIRISGHTDSRGKHEKNMQLSWDRANSVKTYLENKGVEGGRVEVRGVGPDEPIADNKNASGRAQNRRIEFELLPQSQQQQPAAQ